MVQFPLMSDEAVVPETEQTDGVSEATVTIKPEEAVADRPTLVAAVWVGMAGKVMVCGACLTVRVNVEEPLGGRSSRRSRLR